MIIFKSLLTSNEVSVIFEAAGKYQKLSRPNHHNQVMHGQKRETLCALKLKIAALNEH